MGANLVGTSWAWGKYTNPNGRPNYLFIQRGDFISPAVDFSQYLGNQGYFQNVLKLLKFELLVTWLLYFWVRGIPKFQEYFGGWKEEKFWRKLIIFKSVAGLAVLQCGGEHYLPWEVFWSTDYRRRAQPYVQSTVSLRMRGSHQWNLPLPLDS